MFAARYLQFSSDWSENRNFLSACLKKKVRCGAFTAVEHCNSCFVSNKVVKRGARSITDITRIMMIVILKRETSTLTVLISFLSNMCGKRAFVKIQTSCKNIEEFFSLSPTRLEN